MDISKIDISLFYFINETMQNSFFDIIMPMITDIDNWKIVIFIFWIALIIKGGKKGRIAALLVIAAVGLSDLAIAQVIKPFAGRVRPCNTLPHVHLLVGCGGMDSYSFPSSHASNIFAVASYLGYKYRRFAIVFFFIAALVGFSRVYVGVHYPFDVIGGAIFGIACAGIILIIEKGIGILINKRKLKSFKGPEMTQQEGNNGII
ncbi:MAG: phosphatase PAP2 family protein [Pseudomonadota bacterium]